MTACPTVSNVWFGETHLAIAEAAGYHRWYNAAAAADIAKERIGDSEG
jgi:hypothetical protein